MSGVHTRHAPGADWLKDRPRLLEAAYRVSKRLIAATYPIMRRLSPRGAERIMIWSEELLKGYAFGCRMCGQCVLHSTGMTCPMTCPKNLRNGPCGGVRQDGHCEVYPQMPCVWVQAWEGSQNMKGGERIREVQPPIDHRLKGRSSWLAVVAAAAPARDARP